jgi:hypothetical protein
MSGKGAKGLSGKGAKGTMGDKKGDKKKPTSRSARAGLQFPVGRIHRLLKVSQASICPIAVVQPFIYPLRAPRAQATGSSLCSARRLA